MKSEFVDGVSCGDRDEVCEGLLRCAEEGSGGRVLDEVVAVTGWSRDDARRRLSAAAKAPPGCRPSGRGGPGKQRPDKFSYDAG